MSDRQNYTMTQASANAVVFAGLGAEPSAAPRCETCAHWSFAEPDWEFDELRFGTCKAIKQREDISSEAVDGLEDRWSDEAREATRRAIAGSKAIAVDGSGYYAAVRTAPDFGCVLHASPPPPSNPQTQIPGDTE